MASESNPTRGGNDMTLDDRDAAIARTRMTALDAREGPRVGDFVRFADGVERRISHLWDNGVQTSDGGRFYLGDYGCSFSGALHLPVHYESLTLTDERQRGWVWIFHHDVARAHNGVDFTTEFRVYTCSLEST